MTPFREHSGNKSMPEAVGQASAELIAPELEEFLRSGFCFGLENDRVLLGWGEPARASEPGIALAAVYAPDFYLTDSVPWWLFPKLAMMEKADIVRFLDVFLGNVNAENMPWAWQEPAQHAFSGVFARLQSAFSQGIAEKAVPVVFATATGEITPIKTARILRNGLEAGPPLRLYGVWSDQEGMIGLTPELLFRLCGSQSLETMALAGTRHGSLSVEGAQEFLHDPKESVEHRVVVDDLSRVLSRLGRVEIGETSVLRLPTLSHLHTPLGLESDAPLDFARVAQLLHPTPALGVSPRELGLEWMKTWDDSQARNRFGAPFGVWAPGFALKSTDCLVAIRNIQWQSGSDFVQTRFIIGSGCGLVAQSREESEWKELAAKRDSVKLLLGLS